MIRRSLSHWLPAILLGVLLAVSLTLFIRYQRKPVIVAVSNLVAKVGDNIEITGRFFGEEFEGAKLLIGGQAITSASIVEWTDMRIVARIPRLNGATMIKVKNRSGISNGFVLGDANRFPEVRYGSWLPGSPFIEYIQPSIGAPGTLVSMHGKGFSPHKGNGEIWMNRTDQSGIFSQEPPDLRMYTKVMHFDLWTDTEIRFWMPSNIATGNLYLRRGGKFSNPIPFEIPPRSNHFEIGDFVRWSLRQEISINQIGAFPGNALYLRIPSPVDNQSQKPAVVFNANDNPQNHFLRQENNLDIFRLDELRSGENRLTSRQMILDTASVKVVLNSEDIAKYDPTHPELALSLIEDKWIRPNSVSNLAHSIAGNNQNYWRKAQAVYHYVINRLEISESPPSRIIAEYPRTKLADSEGYSFLFCSIARAIEIPARPVSGILIESNGNVLHWFWAEFWVEGLGWVPVDPALGDGDSDTSKEYYFAGLDERHIAFSRGIHASEALQPDTEIRIPNNFYSLQNIWEEAWGNLHSYSSVWTLPRITGFYH